MNRISLSVRNNFNVSKNRKILYSMMLQFSSLTLFSSKLYTKFWARKKVKEKQHPSLVRHKKYRCKGFCSKCLFYPFHALCCENGWRIRVLLNLDTYVSKQMWMKWNKFQSHKITFFCGFSIWIRISNFFQQLCFLFCYNAYFASILAFLTVHLTSKEKIKLYG